MTRAIIHVDMDAFFTSVEQLDFPELRGKPVVVGGEAESRGVVAAASYEVRRFGVHSAMPTGAALRLCPQAILRPVRMKRYAEISSRIHEILLSYTPLVEPISIDEAFLDVTGSARLFGDAEAIGREIKRRIREETGLTASVGIAPNMFLAKLASSKSKPDGFLVISEEEKEIFLAPLSVSEIWGVGPATEASLNKLGVRTIAELRKVPLGALKSQFGKFAESLRNMAWGIDEREVTPESLAKSLSSEVTFPRDVSDMDALRRPLYEQAYDVARRLQRDGLAGRCVTLKVRYADFRTITRSATLEEHVNTSAAIYDCAKRLLDTKVELKGSRVRLVGVGVSNLAETIERQLKFPFGDGGRRGRADKRLRAQKALDDVKRKMGEGVINRGDVK
jgi:DNA polymerase-4